MLSFLDVVSDTGFDARKDTRFFEAYWTHALIGCAHSLVRGKRHTLSAASMYCHQLGNFTTKASFFQQLREYTTLFRRVETDCKVS